MTGLPVHHSIPWVRDSRHTPWQFRSISIQTGGLSPAGHPGTKRNEDECRCSLFPVVAGVCRHADTATKRIITQGKRHLT
jgi:hypothetical protein